METGSYLLLGTEKAMEETFGSTAHGSGRTMSRTAAKKQVSGEQRAEQPDVGQPEVEIGRASTDPGQVAAGNDRPERDQRLGHRQHGPLSDTLQSASRRVPNRVIHLASLACAMHSVAIPAEHAG